MIVLVPVRQPLNDRNRAALERALELVDGDPEGEVLVLHVNLVHRNGRVDRAGLRTSVEEVFGEIPASFVVRDGVRYEEAILDEAARQDVDAVVVSERRRGALQRALRRALDAEVDLAAYLREHLEAETHIIAG